MWTLGSVARCEELLVEGRAKRLWREAKVEGNFGLGMFHIRRKKAEMTQESFSLLHDIADLLILAALTSNSTEKSEPVSHIKARMMYRLDVSSFAGEEKLKRGKWNQWNSSCLRLNPAVGNVDSHDRDNCIASKPSMKKLLIDQWDMEAHVKLSEGWEEIDASLWQLAIALKRKRWILWQDKATKDRYLWSLLGDCNQTMQMGHDYIENMGERNPGFLFFSEQKIPELRLSLGTHKLFTHWEWGRTS